MFSKSFYKLMFVKPENMFNKYFRNHDITHKLLLVELENMFIDNI